MRALVAVALLAAAVPAKNALDISQRLAEIPTGAPEINELASLQRMTEQKLAAVN